ncbi:MAG: hypothetical protein JWM84_3629 [Nocardioides sp.]|nr:hypothetical protein [Nocardioides sp.]
MAKKRRKSEQTLTDKARATPDKKAPGRGTWRVMDRGSSVAAGLLATRAAAIAWRTATGRKPPTSGRHPEVSTREAVAWAMLGGGLIELVKVGVRRGTATYWVKSTGRLPPGMKPLTKTSGNEAEPVPSEPAPVRSTPKKKVSRRSRGR